MSRAGAHIIMGDVRVRTATDEDVDALSVLLADTWHATYDALYGRDRVDQLTRAWHSPAVLRRQLADPACRRLVAFDGERLAATALTERHPDGRVKLAQLYVLPGAQGRGIGGLLMSALLAHHREAPSIMLEVEPANARAVAFYGRFGFERVGAVASCGRDSGIPADVYERRRTGEA